MSGRRDGARARRGFTLVEMLLVLLVVGLLATLAAPALGPRRDLRGRRACELAVYLSNARRWALLSGSLCVLELSGVGGSVVIAQRGVAADQPPALEPLRLGMVESLDEAGQARQVTADEPLRIVFTPLGSATAPRLLRLGGEGAALVELDARLGAARVISAERLRQRAELLEGIDAWWQGAWGAPER